VGQGPTPSYSITFFYVPSGVDVTVGVSDGVSVGDGEGVRVAVAVLVAVEVLVGVWLGTWVLVAVLVSVGLCGAVVCVAVAVFVGVAVPPVVAERVTLAVALRVAVAAACVFVREGVCAVGELLVLPACTICGRKFLRVPPGPLVAVRVAVAVTLAATPVRVGVLLGCCVPTAPQPMSRKMPRVIAPTSCRTSPSSRKGVIRLFGLPVG